MANWKVPTSSGATICQLPWWLQHGHIFKCVKRGRNLAFDVKSYHFKHWGPIILKMYTLTDKTEYIKEDALWRALVILWV